jgi:LysR family transcriptional regulator (chromosome initiation inhibitor)
VQIDDQDHTHQALKHGDVLGCVSTRVLPMRGCLAEPLGVLRYRCVGASALLAKCRTRGGAVAVHRLLAQPALVFNRKDGLQDEFLKQHFALSTANYPRHLLPAVDAYECALENGLGWGMVSDLHLAMREHRPLLEQLLPGTAVDVALYWHHWEHEPATAQSLTQAVKQAALKALA